MFRTKHPSRRVGDESTAAAGAPRRRRGSLPTSRPACHAGAPLIGRRRRSAGSRSCWSPSRRRWSGRSRSTRTRPGRASRAACRRSSTRACQPVGENVLIQSRSRRVGDAAFTAAIRDVVVRVSGVAAVQNVHKGPISNDRHSALIEFDIRGDREKAVDKIKPVLDSVAAAQRAHPSFVIGEFGLASAMKGVDTAFGDDLGKAGTLAADHLDHPRARVRRTRGGRDSAAAWADRCSRRSG